MTIDSVSLRAVHGTANIWMIGFLAALWSHRPFWTIAIVHVTWTSVLWTGVFRPIATDTLGPVQTLFHTVFAASLCLGVATAYAIIRYCKSPRLLASDDSVAVTLVVLGAIAIMGAVQFFTTSAIVFDNDIDQVIALLFCVLATCLLVSGAWALMRADRRRRSYDNRVTLKYLFLLGALLPATTTLTSFDALARTGLLFIYHFVVYLYIYIVLRRHDRRFCGAQCNHCEEQLTKMHEKKRGQYIFRFTALLFVVHVLIHVPTRLLNTCTMDQCDFIPVTLRVFAGITCASLLLGITVFIYSSLRRK